MTRKRTYIRCCCCDRDAEYKHWYGDDRTLEYFCEQDKCGDCEYVGWQKRAGRGS